MDEKTYAIYDKIFMLYGSTIKQFAFHPVDWKKTADEVWFWSIARVSQYVHECYEGKPNDNGGELEELPEQNEITVKKIKQVKTGERNGRPWTLYLLETSGGGFYTFDGGFEVGKTYGIEFKTEQRGETVSRTITKKFER
jgi:hypothetical protein